MKLAKYIKKRDFKKTPEPKGRVLRTSKKLTFVVQRHDATTLHYDFRLELDGVLKSWAVPKGPSLDPSDKRLAVQVEDHPLSYGKFEGVIPKGNYGAGTVEIWDKGTYTADQDTNGNAMSTLRKGLQSGSLKFTLHGKKLKGSFALVRMKDGKEKNWLLIKHRDEFATNGKESGAKKEQTPVTSVRSPRAKERKFKDYIKPMLATLTDEPFDNPDWIFEVKWDGYRAIAEINKGDVKFYSRNGLSFVELYPEVAAELKKIKKNCTIDGEVVVLDEDGKPSFQKLQQFGMNRHFPILYYVFDCLSYSGKDISDKPLVERKKILEKLLPKSNVLKYSEHIAGDGISFYNESKKLDLEGIMAKRSNSVYETGRRTADWLKVKNHNTQEAVIAGYTAPRASRKYFGSLVLGIYQKGKLKYMGHTGTGYTEKVLKDVFEQLQPYTTDFSPFDTKVPLNSAVTWVKPLLVCNVKYSELTHDGILRHPVFMGLRIDKKANEVDQLEANMKTPTKKKPARKVAKKTPSRKTDEGKGITIKANGHDVLVTNTQKVFWPDEGYTKGDVIDYYNTISSFILPHLKDRPQSLKRNPNGIKDKGFFHKDAGGAAPSWVEHTKVRSDSTQKIVNYILCNNKATLLYLANLGCIELNPWNSRIKSPDHPDYLIMDIDPSDSNTFKEVVDVAIVIKEVLDKAGASCYCKTSGATGIHIYVPLHAAYTYEQARHFAEIVAVLTAEQIPKLATVERSLDKRKGRIYVDYLQNSRGQTLSSVYSIRPVPGATVSTPIEWKELTHDLDPKDFTIKTIHKRLGKLGDIFSGVLKDKNNLIKCIKALEGDK
jgi:bifunctional non-homologous end joining protein LigD